MDKNKCTPCKKTSIGGQALIEGIMMRGPKKTAMAVRHTSGEIRIKEWETGSASVPKFFKIPIIRGIYSFIVSMKIGYKCLMDSAEMSGLEDEINEEAKSSDANEVENTDASAKESSKSEEKTDKKRVVKAEEKKSSALMNVLMVVASVLGVALALLLFLYLPVKIVDGIAHFAPVFSERFLRSFTEGILRIVIFVVYMASMSLMKDIRRTFMYHGAEHKSIFCYEAGLELTVENIKKMSRFHPRCGTALMFVIILISILVSAIIPAGISQWLRMALKLLTLPLTVGIGYEYVMYAGKHDNPVTRFFSAPGLWMQRITTKEPDDSQIEIAITALKLSMPSVFPDFAPENGKMFEEETKEADNDEKNG